MARPQQRESPRKTVRYPFPTTYVSRELSTADLGTYNPLDFDMKYVNCYLAKVPKREDEESGIPEWVIKKRPGWAQHAAPAADTVVPSAIHVWTGSADEVITAMGATTSTIYSNTTSLGALSANHKVRWITPALIGSTHNLVFVTENDNIWFYPLAGALTEVTDADMPGNNGFTLTGKAIHMDGYLFILTTSGRLYNSDLDSLSAWTATGFISTNMYPDLGLGLIRYKNQLVAVGRESMEFFTNVGNPVASPLQKNQSIALRIGCPNQYSFTEMEDTIVFVGSSSGGMLGLYYMDGYTPTKVKDPMIDLILERIGATNVRVQVLKMDNENWIMLSGNSIYFLYSFENTTWHLWEGASSITPWDIIATDARGTIYGIKNSDLTATNGRSFKLDTENTQDASTNFTLTIVTPRVDLGIENQKRLHKLRLIGDTQESTTTTNISWSDDDYRTFSSARSVDMGSSFDRAYITQCGTFRRRAFKITYAGSNPWRVQALEMDVTLGRH